MSCACVCARGRVCVCVFPNVKGEMSAEATVNVKKYRSTPSLQKQLLCLRFHMCDQDTYGWKKKNIFNESAEQ